MKTIKRTISLESFLSRLPLAINAYDNEGKLNNFNNNPNIIGCYPMGNYGMTPCDVVFSTSIITDFDNSLFKKIDNTKYAIPYPLLNAMYHFFIEYRSLLYSKECPTDKEIHNAIEYWSVYGGDYDYYAGMDATYKSYGGDAMCSYILDEVCKPIEDIDENRNIETAEPTFNLSLLLTNNIEDLGEYSILSDEWNDKLDYSKEGLSSTTVVYDGEVYLKSGDSKGYIFDNQYKVSEFDKNAWVKYLNVHEEPIEEDNYYKAYAYNYADKMVLFTDRTEGETVGASKMSENIEITSGNNGFVAIGNTPYVCYEKEYILDPTSDGFLFVNYDQYGRYVIYKNRKYYADANGMINVTKVICGYEGKNEQISGGTFIYKDFKWYMAKDDTCKINGHVYPCYGSYFQKNNVTNYINYHTIYNVDANGEVAQNTDLGSYTQNAPTNATFGYYIDYGNLMVKLYSPYVVYDTDVITGYTTSKLTDFKRKDRLVDMRGVMFEGRYDIENQNVAHPLEDTIIDLCYKIGDATNLSLISGNTYWGNYLSEMSFYYEDAQGNRTSSVFNASDYDGDNLQTIEETIQNWKDNNANCLPYFKNSQFEPTDMLKCKFTYYNGAILIQNNDGSFDLYDSSNKFLNGVKNEDTVTLYKTSTIYYITNNDNYNIYYYEISHELLKCDYNGTVIDLPKTKFSVAINTKKNDGEGLSFSKYNGLVYSPIFRNENKIGSSMKSKVDNDIFIDRPIIKPMEKNLFLMDVHSMDALENYGNGTINIIKTN